MVYNRGSVVRLTPAERAKLRNAERAKLRNARKRKDAIAWTLIALWVVAVAVVSIWFDLAWFLVGGIHEAVKGAQDNNTNQLTWGVIRALCTGVGVFVGIIVGYLGVMGIAKWADKR